MAKRVSFLMCWEPMRRIPIRQLGLHRYFDREIYIFLLQVHKGPTHHLTSSLSGRREKKRGNSIMKYGGSARYGRRCLRIKTGSIALLHKGVAITSPASLSGILGPEYSMLDRSSGSLGVWSLESLLFFMNSTNASIPCLVPKYGKIIKGIFFRSCM
jgi:hypothetical protein